MNYSDDYRRLIIEPLEEYKRELMVKFEKTFFFKKLYEELLNKVETELLNKYQKYYDMCMEEIEFNKCINKKLES